VKLAAKGEGMKHAQPISSVPSETAVLKKTELSLSVRITHHQI